MKKQRKALKNRTKRNLSMAKSAKQQAGAAPATRGTGGQSGTGIHEDIYQAYEYVQSLPQDSCCSDTARMIEEQLNAICSSKENVTGGTESPCSQSTEETSSIVDLIILFDASFSMRDEAIALGNAAQAAISAANASCPSSLQITWLGMEGTFGGIIPQLQQTVRQYFRSIGIDTRPATTPLTANYSSAQIPTGDQNPHQEDAAANIIDLVNHYNWRPDALKNIFFLGDEGLVGGNPTDAEDNDMAIIAADVCNNFDVKVHVYAGSPHQMDEDYQADFQTLANSTGGEFFLFSPRVTTTNFTSILTDVICSSTNQYTCTPAEVTHIKPCFEFNWGDGPSDVIDQNDLEIVCITACNPYSNVIFRDVTINVAVITDAAGAPVGNTSNGFPRAIIKPSYQICFGDLKPCDRNHPNQRSCTTREFVMGTQNAVPGSYSLQISYCYSIEYCCLGNDSFEFTVTENLPKEVSE